MDRSSVGTWIEGYLQAWSSNDPEDIARLFTDDADYHTAPHREPWSGTEDIVEGWIGRKDEPGNWRFRHEILALAGDLAFVRGWTDYLEPPQRYSNLWVIRLADGGRCSEFTEWWMEYD